MLMETVNKINKYTIRGSYGQGWMVLSQKSWISYQRNAQNKKTPWCHRIPLHTERFEWSNASGTHIYGILRPTILGFNFGEAQPLKSAWVAYLAMYRHINICNYICVCYINPILQFPPHRICQEHGAIQKKTACITRIVTSFNFIEVVVFVDALTSWVYWELSYPFPKALLSR